MNMLSGGHQYLGKYFDLFVKRDFKDEMSKISLQISINRWTSSIDFDYKGY